MERQLIYGTDGIRGPIAVFDLQGVKGIGTYLGEQSRGKGPVLLGRDTRQGSLSLLNAMVAGVESAGGEVMYGNVLPTPLISYAARELGTPYAVSLTASHNPADEAGIKIFEGPRKIDCGLESELHQLYRQHAGNENSCFPGVLDPRSSEVDEVVSGYFDILESLVDTSTMSSFAFDTANGATAPLLREFINERGYQQLATIGYIPDGRNINRTGTEHPATLQGLVYSENLPGGFAVDGDGDRLRVVNEKGELVDGNHVLGYLAKRLHEASGREESSIVLTEYANRGIDAALEGSGITIHRVINGDRSVRDAMASQEAIMGGEPSGHILLDAELGSSDALKTAFSLIGMLPDGAELGDELDAFPLHASKTFSLPYSGERETKRRILDKAEKRTREELGEDGTVLLRFSGTQPLIRGYVEGPVGAQVERSAERLEERLRKSL